ncbi:MAG: glycosyltransferase family 87 protein, partial [Thermoanaerobaculia bacterium]
MNSYLKHKEFSKGIANALVILLFLYGILSLGVGIRNALLPRQSQDLAPVYRAAHSWIAGHDPYEIQRPAPGELPAGAPAAFSTPYAFTAILDTALVAWLPWQRARIAWIALNLVLLVAGFILVLQAAGSEFSPHEGVALLALLWSGEGVRVCLGNGQHSIVVFFSVALMTWAMQSRRDAIAGGALALSLHKFSWTPFMAIVPFAKGRQRVLVFAFLTACMELAIFVARIGVGTARQALASYRKEILWWTSHTQKAEFDRFGFSQLSAVWFDVL